MATVDSQELDRFEVLSKDWWNVKGPFKPLHLLNPARLSFIHQSLRGEDRFKTPLLHPLAGLSLLDVGCGGGLLTEPLARSGAKMTGIDAGQRAIETAQAHANTQDLFIDYAQATAEDWTLKGHQYDAVISMEVIEHVANVQEFIDTLSSLVKPKGFLILSTLNRTLKSYLVAILGAEYILRMVPRKTHDWSKFISPAELAAHCHGANLRIVDIQGMKFRPWAADFILSPDVTVNYLLCAQKA